MTNDKVYCPWCGSEMELEHLGSDDCEAFLYACHKCGASSPMKSSNDEALQAALARPLQKPLTLEEACGSEEPCVFIEHLRFKSIHAADVVLSPEPIEGKCAVEIQTIGTSCIAYSLVEEYGTTWRCWATKPTDEEREAAKWDE